MDLDVGDFLDSLQLNNLKDIFEKEQVRNCKKVLELETFYLRNFLLEMNFVRLSHDRVT